MPLNPEYVKPSLRNMSLQRMQYNEGNCANIRLSNVEKYQFNSIKIRSIGWSTWVIDSCRNRRTPIRRNGIYLPLHVAQNWEVEGGCTRFQLENVGGEVRLMTERSRWLRSDPWKLRYVELATSVC